MALLLLHTTLLGLAANSSDSTPYSVTNGYDDDLYRFSFGAPGHCVGETPKCGDVGAVKKGVTQHFDLAPGSNYLSVGGGIKTTKDGSVCHTWLSDNTFCAIYPGSAEGDCARLTGATCTQPSPGVYLISATIDRTCDTLPYEDCTSASVCCGAANTCKQYDPKVNETKCWPN